MLTTSETIVDKAVDLDMVSLQYRVQMTPTEAAAFCERRDPWIGDLLAEIDKVIPLAQYEDTSNPNHNTTHHHYYIGREYSRVIYVEVFRNYLTSCKESRAIAAKIEELAKKYEADEINDEGEHGGSLLIRIWWD